MIWPTAWLPIAAQGEMTIAQVTLLVTAIPCGLGAIFILIAYLRGRMTAGWVKVTGVVVDRATGGTSGGMPAIYPTFRWRDRQGDVHQRTSMVRASLGPSPGKQIPVLYDPEQPSRGVIDSYAQTLRIFFPIGIALVVIGVLAGTATLVLGSSSGS